MKTLIGVLLGVMISNVTISQDMDEARMARDIKVAEDIISSLMSQSKGGNIWRNTQVNGNYVQNYGVIFNVPASTFNWPMGIKLWDGEFGHLVMGNKVKIADDDVLGFVENIEAYQEEKDEYLEAMMTTFLADYADLIGQLKPSDKIMINSEQRLNNVFVLGSDSKFRFQFGDDDDIEVDNEVSEACCDGGEDYIFTAVVLKSDLTDYRSGRLSREELLDRISVEKQQAYKEKEPELELLSSIFSRLYKADLSNTYFATRAPRYNRISNLGVIYEWQVYSSNIDDEKHNMPTIDSFGLSMEERNAKVEQLYPVFVDQFKQQLVEYGRTIKGLAKDEMLMFKIKLTQCQGCSIPHSIEFSVKSSVLDEFERQKISLDAAARKVKVQEHIEG